MKFVLVSLSALLFMACSGGGSGGGGVTTYKYQVSGMAPFSTGDVTPSAAGTAFVLKWNETSTTITGIYTAGGESKPVTGTIAGGVRKIDLAVNPPENGISKLRIEMPTGAVSGTIAATLTGLDADGTQVGSPINLSLEGTTNTDGGNTTVTMPTVACTTGASIVNPSAGDQITLTTEEGPVAVCIKAANKFSVPVLQITEGSYSYAQNSTNYRVGELTLTWNNGQNKILAALCFTTSVAGTFAANSLDEGETTSVTGTWAHTAAGAGGNSCPQ